MVSRDTIDLAFQAKEEIVAVLVRERGWWRGFDRDALLEA
jgi:hypothetical protein